MYEELVKKLREQGNWLGYTEWTRDAFFQAADAIEALEAKLEVSPEVESFINNKADKIIEELQSLNNSIEQRSGWISVTERLPRPEVPVLVTYIGYGTGEIGTDLIATLFGDGMWCYWDGEPCSFDECKVEITHWMPLPEPPKEASK